MMITPSTEAIKNPNPTYMRISITGYASRI
jgi:hypothetical protein